MESSNAKCEYVKMQHLELLLVSILQPFLFSFQSLSPNIQKYWLGESVYPILGIAELLDCTGSEEK
jgi:hypothetical protein